MGASKPHPATISSTLYTKPFLEDPERRYQHERDLQPLTRVYTRLVQGLVALTSAVFPAGTHGPALEASLTRECIACLLQWG